MLERVGDGLEFGGEFGEGVVDGAAEVVGGVDEEGDGGLGLLVDEEGEEFVGVGRALDEDAVGFEFIERAAEAARRAGAVVADAEDVGG
jgi:hypothetical protein